MIMPVRSAQMSASAAWSRACGANLIYVNLTRLEMRVPSSNVKSGLGLLTARALIRIPVRL